MNASFGALVGLTKLNCYFNVSMDTNLFLAIQIDSKISETAPLMSSVHMVLRIAINSYMLPFVSCVIRFVTWRARWQGKTLFPCVPCWKKMKTLTKDTWWSTLDSFTRRLAVIRFLFFLSLLFSFFPKRFRLSIARLKFSVERDSRNTL